MLPKKERKVYINPYCDHYWAAIPLWLARRDEIDSQTKWTYGFIASKTKNKGYISYIDLIRNIKSDYMCELVSSDIGELKRLGLIEIKRCDWTLEQFIVFLDKPEWIGEEDYEAHESF